tara:strand:+ start:216 stop:1640 length:1425 start_codon:yes stop_codon:yes gene_type:complete
MGSIKVISLFNGMSCARMATEILYGQDSVEVLYSEVDKHANKATQLLFPQDISIGDVRGVDGTQYHNIDMLVGGSPCQSFSFAGKRNGMTTKTNEEILTLEHYLELKQQHFEFEGQSYLFWEYVRVLREVQINNPDVIFLLENVVMSSKWEKIITDTLGVTPFKSNSALISAQNRKRLYWTNINKNGVEQPEDKHIYLKDILEDIDILPEGDILNNKRVKGLSENSQGIRPNQGDVKKSGISELGRVHYSDTEKTSTVTTSHAPKILLMEKPTAIQGRSLNKATIVGRRLNEHGKREDYNKEIPITQYLEVRANNTEKSNCLTTVQKDNVLTWLPVGRYEGIYSDVEKFCNDNSIDFDKVMNETANYIQYDSTGKQHASQDQRLYKQDSKMGTLTAHSTTSKIKMLTGVTTEGLFYRKLTVRECMRLQTIPEHYIDKLLSCDENGKRHVSNSQLYKMAGNGWTVDMIVHILGSV